MGLHIPFWPCGRVSAWAFPRPSAMASAKFANSTVTHKIMATARVKPEDASCDAEQGEGPNSPVVRMAEIYTSSITGFSAGFWVTTINASFTALPSIFSPVKALLQLWMPWENLLSAAALSLGQDGGPVIVNGADKFGDGSQGERREKAECAHQKDNENEQKYKHGVGGGQRAGSDGDFLFRARLPAMASVPAMGRKRANSITSPSDRFKKTVLALKPAKAEPLLAPAEA